MKARKKSTVCTMALPGGTLTTAASSGEFRPINTSLRWIGLSEPSARDNTVAPTFETDDERYAWLNSIQAIGQGRTEGEDIVYEMFEVR